MIRIEKYKQGRWAWVYVWSKLPFTVLLALWAAVVLVILASVGIIHFEDLKTKTFEEFNLAFSLYPKEVKKLEHLLQQRLFLVGASLPIQSYTSLRQTKQLAQIGYRLKNWSQHFLSTGDFYFLAPDRTVIGIRQQNGQYHIVHQLGYAKQLGPLQFPKDVSVFTFSRVTYLRDPKALSLVYSVPVIISKNQFGGWMLNVFNQQQLGKFFNYIGRHQLVSRAITVGSAGYHLGDNSEQTEQIIEQLWPRLQSEQLVELLKVQTAGRSMWLSVGFNGSLFVSWFQIDKKLNVALAFVPTTFLFNQMQDWFVVGASLYVILLFVGALLIRQHLEVREKNRQVALSNALQEAAFESNIAMVVVDPHGFVKKANHYFLTSFQLDDEEFLRQRLDRHLTFSPSVNRILNMAKVRNGWLGEVEVSREQKQIYFKMSVTPVNVGQVKYFYVFSGVDIQEQLALTSELIQRANTDPLTGLYNRNYLEEQLGQELKRCERTNTSLSLVLLDIDHFKQINDQYGHYMGDQVLIGMAKLFRQRTRSNDVFARWGGEEFVLILPDTTLDDAESVAADYQKMLENQVFADVIRCTCSFGVAGWQSGLSSEILFQRADDMLYEAKAAGRNHIVCWREDAPFKIDVATSDS
ncbi:MAG: hypothetical protein CENE_02853 [Candidatus Celerinatantimonas neptuna]|nr:MAG: hypothetical protein CENE_02853 [Candidatus Celerinatantimonas neptuna]